MAQNEDVSEDAAIVSSPKVFPKKRKTTLALALESIRLQGGGINDHDQRN